MSEISEKIGQLIAKSDAAHKRLDKIETDVRDDLKHINDELKAINAHMNKGKGWAAAFLFLAGLSGAGASKLLSTILNP